MPNNITITINIPGLKKRQRRMLENPAQILWCGTGTKTGKTLAFSIWAAQKILAGERCCWIAAWYPRVRAAFETICQILQPFIDAGELEVTASLLRIRGTNGGGLDCYSGENYQNVYGGNYKGVIVDEASRCPSGVWPAVLTTISATHGQVRLAFNLELGRANWAIKHLLRVQAMTPEERIAAGEDYLLFPTLDPDGESLVSPSLVESIRSQMTPVLWEALFRGVIPTSDTSLFRNLDQAFVGQALDGPLDGHQYVCGLDLARKADWSVLTILDSATGSVAATDRFNQVSWNLQIDRAVALYKKFRCTKMIVDATGVGDPIAEALEALGVNVEAFIITVPSRKALLESLILAFDNGAITLPATPDFEIYRHELESWEYVLDGTSVKYSVPSGLHDDTTFSLALAWRAYRGATQGVLGWIEYLKQCASGTRNWVTNAVTATPKTIKDAVLGPGFSLHPPAATPATTATLNAGAAHKPVKANVSTPACVSCGSGLVLRIGQQWHCN